MAEALARGVRLHHQRLGPRGAPARVVFVHGLVVDNLASWYFSVACGAATFADVLVYDLRGHGLSERPANGYRVDDMVLDLASLLDATLGPAPVCLVGNSFGALIALQFARRFPERAAGLVLVDGHLGNDGFADRMAQTLSLRGAEADHAIARTFQHWPGQTSPRKRAKLVEQARALVLGTSLVEDLRSTPALGAREFARIETPTLALYGERSDIVAVSAPMLASMPCCTLEVLAGCTHSVLWEATGEVRERTVAFCQRRFESRGAA
jgi:pimeloyl-ACP methyl ester carboxylesterase